MNGETAVLKRASRDTGSDAPSGDVRCRRIGRRRWLLCASAALLLPPLFGLIVFHLAVRFWPYPTDLDRQAPQSLQLLDRHGVPLAALVAADGQWRMDVSLAQISPQLRDAMVAVEDGRFYQHGGTDWTAGVAAAGQNLLAGRFRRGASTLTMQLHRLRAGTPRTLWGKFEQVVRARQIEQVRTKQQILLEYLNRAPFGGNLEGVQAASWRYFGKDCGGLTLAQSALLAGLPQSPSRYRPDRYPERARVRRDHVLDRMLACALITPQQHAEAKSEPVRASWTPLPQSRPLGSAAADGAMPTLLSLGRAGTGPVIRSTLDGAIQRQAMLLVQDQLQQLGDLTVDSASVVILDNATAQCLAAVSLCRDAPHLDLTRRPRSTGSVLKPFIFAAAFDAGLATPDTILQDALTAWPGYFPRNFDGNYRGEITAGQSLAESRNIPALLLLSRLGVTDMVDLLRRLGLRSLSRRSSSYGLSLAIGGAEATPLELAEAYAALARGGTWRATAFSLASASSPQNTPAPSPLSEAACRQTLHALSDPLHLGRVLAHAGGQGMSFKTGTSSGQRDAWCAAVTSRHTVIVWMGSHAGRGSGRLTGIDAAAPVALRILSELADPASRSTASRSTTIVPAAASRMPLAATPLAGKPVVIAFPTEGAEIVLEGDVSSQHARVLLRANTVPTSKSGGGGGATLWWLMNGQRLGTTRNPHEIWWTPAPGRNHLRVMDEHGSSSAVQFTVVSQ